MENYKDPVRLREKKLTKGKTSLYLDVYKDGKRLYEFLKLYLVPEVTKADRDRNKQTMQLARSIQAKRLIEIQNGTFGFDNKFKQDINFIEYYKDMVRQRIASKGNHGNWESALKHLLNFCKATTTFKDVDARFLEDFKLYLATTVTKSGVPLSQNSQHSYFCKVKACINHAFEQRIIPYNVGASVSVPPPGEPERDYLTLDEVRALVKTECKSPVLKRAFLFSCLTGIRWSDINKMTWSEVQDFNGNTRIVFRQKKTKGVEYLDINDQAIEFMGERGAQEERVFQGLKYSGYNNTLLIQWCLTAGINKSITFHCGRHTFAIMMLDLGADIYTVSKLLGHKELKTTQIYAKVLDKKKQAAVGMIPKIF